MVRIPTAQTDPNSKGSGGKWIDAEGLYHLAVEAARDMTHLDEGARVEFDLVVLKSDQDGQEEKKMTEKFYVVGSDPEKTKACLNRLTRFFCATLIYSEAQWQEDIANGVDRDFDIDEVVGRQFCTHITLRKGTKPKQDGTFAMFPNIGFELWAVGDEEADACPKHKEWVNVLLEKGKLPTRKGDWRVPGTSTKLATENKPTPKSTQPAAAKTPPKASTPPAAKAAPADPIDDIPF